MSNAPTPTAKRRMGILKKLSIGAAAMLACLVLAVVILTQLAARWEARVPPLSADEVRRLMARNTAPDSDEIGKTMDTKDGRPSDRRGGGSGSDTDPSGKGAADPADPRGPEPVRLASRPIQDQVAHAFGLPTSGSAPSPVVQRAAVFGLKVGFMAFYEIGGRGAVGFSPTERVASCSLVSGDLDSARSWLREGIRSGQREDWQRLQAGMLAWLEEDPEVAAALLEESCSGNCGDPGWGWGTWVAPANALDLCIATGSEDLAERYYLRYRDSWSKWMESPIGPGDNDPSRSEREAWIRNYEAKAGAK